MSIHPPSAVCEFEVSQCRYGALYAQLVGDPGVMTEAMMTYTTQENRITVRVDDTLTVGS